MAVSPDTQTLPASPQPEPGINPDRFPERYAMRLVGDCMEPELRHGELMLFDRTLPYGPGDLVVLFTVPEHRRPDDCEAVLKRLVMQPPHG